MFELFSTACAVVESGRSGLHTCRNAKGTSFLASRMDQDSPDTSSPGMPELAEIRYWRQRSEEIRKELDLRTPVTSPDEWLSRAARNCDAKWLVAFSCVCLPVVGETISA